MNIKFLLLAILLAATLPVVAQEGDYLHDPRTVSYRGDMPRSRILSFNNHESALTQDITQSNYIQWLNGTWKVQRFASQTEIDPSLLAPATDLGSWTNVTIPEQQIATGWAAVYRTEFRMPFAWIDRQVFIHVGTVDKAYYVYINEKIAGYHEDSKTGVDYDITQYVIEGKNHLAIVAYGDPLSARLENQTSVKGTAITQDVYILSQPKIRIRDYVFDAGFDNRGTGGLFNFGAIVKSHLLNPKEVIVHCELIAPDSTVVFSGRRDAKFEMRLEDTVRFFANIPNVQSWSHESPNLYTVVLRLEHQKRITEYMAYKIGFREIQFDNEGMLVNGHRIVLRPVDLNPPASEEAVRSTLTNLKNSGVNMVRLINFPQNHIFYDVCDELGIYVCNTANIDTHLSGNSREVGGNPTNDPRWENAYTSRVLNMYYTSKNHPSVVMFALGKEAGNGYNMYEAYLRLKEVEHVRPVIYGAGGTEWNTDMVVGGVSRDETDKRASVAFRKTAQEAIGTGGVAPAERFTIQEERPGVFLIENRNSIANLNNFEVYYRINQKRKLVTEGLMAADAVAGGSTTVTVPTETLKPGDYSVTISICRTRRSNRNEQREMITEKLFSLNIPKPVK